MAVLIDLEGDSDFSVMCSECSAVFELQYKRGFELSYCPFCGDELEDELDDQ